MFTYFLNKANNFLNILQMLRLFPIAGNQQYQSLRHWLNNHMKKLEHRDDGLREIPFRNWKGT